MMSSMAVAFSNVEMVMKSEYWLTVALMVADVRVSEFPTTPSDEGVVLAANSE